jgi:hypothetical protein
LSIRNINQNGREKETDSTNSKQRLIGKVLSPAVKLFLRSQVEKVSHLEVKISGGDWQILSGSIPHVSISASQAVYQGLHLSQIQLAAEGIRTNLGQVIKGQPLRLLEPVPVFGELILQQSDLNATLQAPLLSNALTDLLKTLFPESSLVKEQSNWHKIAIATNQLIIETTVIDENNRPIPVVIRTGVKLVSCREIQLTQPQIQTPTGLAGVELDSFKLDLGPEVAIEELSLNLGQLICRGRINVAPA